MEGQVQPSRTDTALLFCHVLTAAMAPAGLRFGAMPSAIFPPNVSSFAWSLAYATTKIDSMNGSLPTSIDCVTGAGWLITTSAGLLNLWACTCIGSPGEPALQLVHALETEFLTSDMQIDPAHNLLMAVGRDTKALTECVALHHLRLQPGVFRLKGRLNLPCGVTARLAKNTGPVKALQVSSQALPAATCLLMHVPHQTLY